MSWNCSSLLLAAAASVAAALPAQAPPAPSVSPSTPATQDPKPAPTTIEDRLQALEDHVKAADAELAELRKKGVKAESPAKWYDKLSIRGYGQIRYTSLLGEDNTPNLNVPADRSVNEPETLVLRRGRVILSGDVSERVFVYAQMDFAASTGSGDQALQMRDFYADLALDDDKESRVRVGNSKVPFGWVNLQSSQNRLGIERPDAINSVAEGERDMGAYYMWAPKHVRDLFRDLVRSGRKGSGDYGVFTVGAFTGQGPNRADQNGEVHAVARVSYPFELENKQVVELGVQGYTGDYVVTTAAIGATTPTVDTEGVTDERIAATFVLYPQPFGLEAEWNWGTSPQLSDNLLTIDDEYVQGGYVQASYMMKGDSGTWTPFTRWNFFDGARKFARNAPKDEVNELDIGIEWQATPDIELTMMYTHTFWRTDTSTAPFDRATDDDRIGLQVQFNF